MIFYENACSRMCQVEGIRFIAIINKNGRRIAGGFNGKIIPLEKNEQKMEMMFMELTLDLSMRKEFDNSLGYIHAIVSYRDNATIISIPHQENLVVLSVEPELDPSKIIQIIQQNLASDKIMEVMIQ